MKKIVALALSLCLVFGLAACGVKKNISTVEELLGSGYERTALLNTHGKVKALFVSDADEECYVYSAESTDEYETFYEALSFDDPDYDEKINRQLASLADYSLSCLENANPGSEALSKWVGDSLYSLELAGFYETGCLVTDDEESYTYSNGTYEIEVTMDAGGTKIADVLYAGVSYDILEESFDKTEFVKKLEETNSIKLFYNNEF